MNKGETWPPTRGSGQEDQMRQGYVLWIIWFPLIYAWIPQPNLCFQLPHFLWRYTAVSWVTNICPRHAMLQCMQDQRARLELQGWTCQTQRWQPLWNCLSHGETKSKLRRPSQMVSSLMHKTFSYIHAIRCCSRRFWNVVLLRWICQRENTGRVGVLVKLSGETGSLDRAKVLFPPVPHKL